jgi:hypothetical protein
MIEERRMMKTSVSLRVMSKTLSPAEITAHLGLEPDHTWVMGDVRKGTKLSEVENGWELRSSASGDPQLQDQVTQLLDRTTPVADALKELSEICIVQISCVVYAEDPPPLNFPSDLILRMAALRAALDIDLYISPLE